MAYISPAQKKAMEHIEKLVTEFGKDRWFTQHELPRTTLHSINALIEKGFIERKEGDGLTIQYYRHVKSLEEQLSK